MFAAPNGFCNPKSNNIHHQNSHLGLEGPPAEAIIYHNNNNEVQMIQEHTNGFMDVTGTTTENNNAVTNNDWEYLNEDEPPQHPPLQVIQQRQQQQRQKQQQEQNLFSLNHSQFDHIPKMPPPHNNSHQQKKKPPHHRRVVSDITGGRGQSFSLVSTFGFEADAAAGGTTTAPAPPPPFASHARMVSDTSQYCNPPLPPPEEQHTCSNDPIMSFLLKKDGGNSNTTTAQNKNRDLLRGEQVQQQMQQQMQMPKKRGHRRVVSESNACLSTSAALFAVGTVPGPRGGDKHNALFGKGITDVMMELAHDSGPLLAVPPLKQPKTEDPRLVTKPAAEAPCPGPAIPENRQVQDPLPEVSAMGMPSLALRPLPDYPEDNVLFEQDTGFDGQLSGAIRPLPEEDGPLPPLRPAIRELPAQDTFTTISTLPGMSPSIQRNMNLQVSMANLENAIATHVVQNGVTAPPLAAQLQQQQQQNYSGGMGVPAPPLAAQLPQQQQSYSPLAALAAQLQQQQQSQQQQQQLFQGQAQCTNVPPLPPQQPNPFMAAAGGGGGGRETNTTNAAANNTANANANGFADQSNMNKVTENQDLWNHHIHATDNAWLETLGNIEVEPLPAEEYIMEKLKE